MKAQTRTLRLKQRMTAAMLSVFMLLTILLPGSVLAEEPAVPAEAAETVLSDKVQDAAETAIPAEEAAPAETPAAVEEAAPAAESAVVEEAAPAAAPAVVEGAAPAAELAVAEEAAPVAEPAVVEEAAPAVEPVVVEEAAPAAEPEVVEEASPAAEPEAVEEAAPVAEPAVVEEAAPAVEPAVVEEAAPAAEPEVVEEAAPAAEPEAVEEAAPVAEPEVAEEAAPAEEPAVAEETAVAEEAAPAAEPAVVEEAAPAVEPEVAEEAAPAVEAAAEEAAPAAAGGFHAAQEEVVPAAGEETRSVQIQVGDHIITASGAFPEGTEIQAVEIPKDKAAQMSGKAALFAYDIRLVVDGKVWQPEEYGKDVQISLRNPDGSLENLEVDILHVKADLLDEDGALSDEAVASTIQDLDAGSVEKETLGTGAEEGGVAFSTASFSGFVGSTDSRVVYVYNSTLFNNDSKNYAGVYVTEALKKNTLDAAAAANQATIGVESIADKNLTAPTTESPAIIQGAAVGYDKRLGPTEFELIDPNRPRPEPYSEFKVKILEEKGTDGTVHKKPSGFDGTYVIVRLDVSQFLTGEGKDDLYLHMEQKDNKALMPAATIAKGTAGATAADYTPTKEFTDGLGNRSASYKLSDLLDPSGTTPYVDVILYATAANVAGADAGQANTPNGDVPLAFYVDNVHDYNEGLTEYDPNNQANVDPNDPNAAQAYTDKWHAKFFDAAKATAEGISRYLVKGSDLALETMVENSAGANKDSGTTYWSLKKSMEDPYYDLEADKDPNDAGSGRTVKLMSEVAITNGLTIQGTSETELKKRTLDVNSYDVQVASNTGVDQQTAAESITLKNGWLTIADYSNTTGAEMAIGNNAKFVIDQGGKLIIDATCQLEIEWDGATTTTPTAGQADPILNNGQLDLRSGGEIVNNGIITIEGTEGKPYQPGTPQEQSTIDSQKGSGEMTIRQGATLTNNGALVIYGKLRNEGTLVNNGKYNDVIKSNDPDKGLFDYHKGIQVAWKDDVTQKNVVPGTLTNAKTGLLINNGDIVLTPGELINDGTMINSRGAHIYIAPAVEAIIPITPDPATPTIVSKRIVLNPARLSSFVNNGTLTNNGSIVPALVALNDNIGFGALTSPGAYPETFRFTNNGTLINNGYIWGYNWGMGVQKTLIAALVASVRTENDLWLYLYDDYTFLMILPDNTRLNGTFAFEEEGMVFTLRDKDKTELKPEKDEDGNSVYKIDTDSVKFEFVLEEEFIARVREIMENK